jgi:ribonucleoside-diphosphate reductase alpha chain
MQKRIPWESLEANWLNMEIFEKLSTNAKKASKNNASLIAIAPTKSTALLMGGVSEGINPMPAFTFTQTTAAGNVDRIDPVLLDIVKERCQDVEAAIKEVNDKFGSVQHVSWLSDEEKKVFKTAFEAVLRHASQRSPFIDQWQSVNLFFSADESEDVISAVHKQAFLDEKIVGLYYMHTLAGVKGSTGECEVCQ